VRPVIRAWAALLTTMAMAWAGGTGAQGRVIAADPSNYLALLRTLQPGDTLRLAAGTYDPAGGAPGLPLFGLHGTAGRPITITGPEGGARPLLLGRAGYNTVRLADASHLVVRNLVIDGRDLGGAGVAAQGLTHHITLENLVIRGVGSDQQVDGISTAGAPAWNWVVRGNTIVGAGTGMYFGNSDGTHPFVAGLIERNLVRDTIGYNIQIKHQLPRPEGIGLPAGPSRTIVRRNVFSKSANSATGPMARPNLLVGHFPTSGPGSDDLYEIYGNFFYRNPTEALFQGEGNIAFYANVMFNDAGPALNIQPHNDLPRSISIFGNTVIASDSGIRVSGAAAGFAQRVFGNAVFAAVPLAGGQQRDNFTGSYASAAAVLVAPQPQPERFDAHPKAGALRGTPIDAIPAAGYTEFDRDFDGRPRDWTIRGAYTDAGAQPGRRPRLAVEPGPAMP